MERKLVCPSRHWGVAINATGVWEIRCIGKFCKTSDEGAVIHKFDLATGNQRTRPDDTAVGKRQKGNDHAGHADL